MAIYALGDRVPSIGEGAWIAENATVAGSVSLGDRVNIWFGAIVRGDNDPITIGENTNIQDGSVLHTDDGVPLTIGKNVTVGHMAMLHGCTIGDNSLIGINAVILNGAVIGKHCLIGAKALVAENKVIPDRSLVVGTPGRIIRTLTDEEVAKFEISAKAYIEAAAQYEASLQRIDE
jgi:carbonic anhydrase/acetyltransferase-like protein (isoleucine patch superfamily)